MSGANGESRVSDKGEHNRDPHPDSCVGGWNFPSCPVRLQKTEIWAPVFPCGKDSSMRALWLKSWFPWEGGSWTLSGLGVQKL